MRLDLLRKFSLCLGKIRPKRPNQEGHAHSHRHSATPTTHTHTGDTTHTTIHIYAHNIPYRPMLRHRALWNGCTWMNRPSPTLTQSSFQQRTLTSIRPSTTTTKPPTETKRTTVVIQPVKSPSVNQQFEAKPSPFDSSSPPSPSSSSAPSAQFLRSVARHTLIDS